MNLKEAQKRATELQISGRSKMNKDALLDAIESEEKRQAESLAKRTSTVQLSEKGVRSLRGSAEVRADRSAPSALTYREREENYLAQNGTGRLTARQVRRLNHKANRSLAAYRRGTGPAPSVI